ncbi:MAG: hypothetical protein ACNA8K_13530 [Cyclonatronaceae bacterium]
MKKAKYPDFILIRGHHADPDTEDEPGEDTPGGEESGGNPAGGGKPPPP